MLKFNVYLPQIKKPEGFANIQKSWLKYTLQQQGQQAQWWSANAKAAQLYIEWMKTFSAPARNAFPQAKVYNPFLHLEQVREIWQGTLNLNKTRRQES